MLRHHTDDIQHPKKKKKKKTARERKRGREEQVLCTGKRDEGIVRKRRKLLYRGYSIWR